MFQLGKTAITEAKVGSDSLTFGEGEYLGLGNPFAHVLGGTGVRNAKSDALDGARSVRSPELLARLPRPLCTGRRTENLGLLGPHCEHQQRMGAQAGLAYVSGDSGILILSRDSESVS